VTSSSWSEDDSDSNDAAMTAYRDVTSSRCSRGPQVTDQLTSSSAVSAGASSSPTDLVETFDVYYVLPPSTGQRGGQLASRRHPRAEVMSSSWTERRRPNAAKCLLDAVPPTPGCYNDLRAATLPASASLVNHWTSPPRTGFVSIRLS